MKAKLPLQRQRIALQAELYAPFGEYAGTGGNGERVFPVAQGSERNMESRVLCNDLQRGSLSAVVTVKRRNQGNRVVPAATFKIPAFEIVLFQQNGLPPWILVLYMFSISCFWLDILFSMNENEAVRGGNYEQSIEK